MGEVFSLSFIQYMYFRLTTKPEQQHNLATFDMMRNAVNKERNKIDTLRKKSPEKVQKLFTLAARAVNPFEKMAKLCDRPLISRAGLKIREILCRFKLFDRAPAQTQIVGLCEAPGAFIDEIIRYREELGLPLASWFAVTLREGLVWKLPHRGLIYADVIHDILPGYLTNSWLVTGDGGFLIDYDKLNQQEELNHPLLQAQLERGSSLVAPGGHLVVKCFDLFTQESHILLWRLFHQYQEVYIGKPWGSRIANSEKYIIARGKLPEELKYDATPSPAFLYSVRQALQPIALEQVNALRLAVQTSQGWLQTNAVPAHLYDLYHHDVGTSDRARRALAWMKVPAK